LLVGAFTIVVGITGLISPDSLTTARRLYFATTAGLYAAAAARVAMGVVVILCAPSSRAPRILRGLGAVMCMQALAAALLGSDRARAVLEWETIQGPAVLRVGAAVALAAGVFVAFAVSGRGPDPRRKYGRSLSADH
jgi:hypothetical protein